MTKDYTQGSLWGWMVLMSGMELQWVEDLNQVEKMEEDLGMIEWGFDIDFPLAN